MTRQFKNFSIAGSLLLIVGFNYALAQNTNTVTDPVGFVTINLPNSSDTIVSTPLSKTPVFQGAIDSNSGFQINVLGANFGDLYSLPHYVQAKDGSQAGMLFDVATNTATTITIQNNGVPPTGLTNGVSFQVVPYWTLGSLFPLSDQNVSFTPSGSTLSTTRRTQILLPDTVGSGINRAASKTYFFVTNSFWRSTAASTVNANNIPLIPDSYFIVRNPSNAASGLKLTVAGTVNTAPMTVQLDRITSGANDNYVAISRPIDISLNNLGLINTGAFTPSSNTLTTGRKDQLMVFDNNSLGINKAAAKTYYYLSNATTQGWRSTATGTADVGNDTIPTSAGVIVRKVAANPATSQFWTNTITISNN